MSSCVHVSRYVSYIQLRAEGEWLYIQANREAIKRNDFTPPENREETYMGIKKKLYHNLLYKRLYLYCRFPRRS